MFDRIRECVGMRERAATRGKAAQATAPKPPPIVDVTDKDYAEVVEGSDRLAVVDFWADWCEPCRVISAYVGFLANDYDGRVLVTALDVDENPATAERLNIMGLPTLLLVKQGQEVGRIVGITAYEAIKAQVEAALQPQIDP